MQSSEKEERILALNGACAVWRQLGLVGSPELAEPVVLPSRVATELPAVISCLCSQTWDRVVAHGHLMCELCVGNWSCWYWKSFCLLGSDIVACPGEFPRNESGGTLGVLDGL